MRRRWLIFFAGILIGAGCLWYALQDTDWAEVWTTLRGANYWWLIPSVVVYFTSVWFRSWRWAFLLRSSERISANRLYPIVVIGYMGNNILPFRLGEALRAYVLWRREGINVATSFTTAILERLFDGLTMVLLVLFGLLFFPISALPAWMVPTASAAFLGALAVFLFLAARPDMLRRVAQTLIERLVPARFREPLLGLVEGVVSGLECLRSGRDVLIVFGATLCVWLIEAVKYWLVSFAFVELDASFIAIVLMEGAVNLATALPSPPGYIGTFEIGIKVLEGIGAPHAVARSYVLVLHAILLLPVTLLGLVLMAIEGIRWTDVGKLRDSGELDQSASVRTSP